jgi:hypothetical protein
MATRRPHLSRSQRNARRRRSSRLPIPYRQEISRHRAAIEKLRDVLLEGMVVIGRFHGGVSWRGFMPLVPPKMRSQVVVDVEDRLNAAGRRYIPDLVVRCKRSGRLLLAIEVWDTHPVSPSKRQAYQDAGFPWIEVRAWAVACWRRGRPLPVLDWGGFSLLRSPTQHGLFESLVAVNLNNSDRPPRQFALRSRNWMLPPLARQQTQSA